MANDDDINVSGMQPHYINFNEITFAAKIELPSDKITLGQLRRDYEHIPNPLIGFADSYVMPYPPLADSNKSVLLSLHKRLIPEALAEMLYLERRNVAYADLYNERLDKNAFCFIKPDENIINENRDRLMRFYIDLGLADKEHAPALLQFIRDQIEEKIIPYHQNEKYVVKVRTLQETQRDKAYLQLMPVASERIDDLPGKKTKAIEPPVNTQNIEFDDLISLLKLPSDELTLGKLRKRDVDKQRWPARLDTSVVSWGTVDETPQKAAISENLVPYALAAKLYLERFVAYHMYIEAYGGKKRFLDSQINPHWRDAIPVLENFYTEEGIVSGSIAMNEKLREIKRQVEDIVRKRHGKEPEGSPG